VETGLDTRLQNAAAPLAGDWSDVVERAERLGFRSRRRQRVLFAFAVVALVGAGSALALGDRLFGWFSVAESRQPVPPGVVADVAFIRGRTLHVPGRPDRRLAASLLAPLLGTDAALAVRSSDGRHVAYHAWADETPLLRVADVRGGGDRLLDRGAQTVAWGADGRIAYFRASEARYRQGAYVGNVVVRRSLTSPARAWTRRAGAYEVVAWADDELLVRVRRCVFPECASDPPPGIYALDRTGRLALLPLSTVSALSPDGRHAVGGILSSPGSDSPSPLVRLVDVGRRRALQTVDLTRVARSAGQSPEPFRNGIQRAVWRGDEIVAAASARGSALVSLRLLRGRLQLVGVVRIPQAALPTRYGLQFGTPAFAGARLVVRISGERRDGTSATAIVTCDRRTRSCIRGALLPQREWFTTVENPSRPLP
jgi:hypothetical protein